MIKQFLKISIYAFITFCVLNFSLLLFQIYFNLHIKEIPKIEIGFPFNFYSIFWLNKNDLHHGANLNKLIYNILIFWILVFLYFIFKNNKQQTKNNKQHNE